MTESAQPVAGSLEARIIRACRVHRNCSLTCKERTVENLGEIAKFDMREVESSAQPSFLQRIRSIFYRG